MRLRRRAKRDHRDPPAAPAGDRSTQARSVRAPTAAPTRPGRLHEQAAQLARPGFRDVPAVPPLRRTVFARHEPDRGTDLPGLAKPRACHRRTRGTSARRRGPTPGTVCNRGTTGSPAACWCSRVSIVAISRGQGVDRLAAAARASSASAGGSGSRASAPARARHAARGQPIARLAAAARAAQRIVAAPHLHQLPPTPQHLAQRPLRRRHAMRRAIPPAAIRLGQRRHVAPIGLDLRRIVAIHRRIIRIGDDHLVPRRLERLRHPLALGPRLEQDPHRAPTREHRRPIARRVVTTRRSRRTRPSASMIRIWLYRRCRSMAP